MNLVNLLAENEIYSNTMIAGKLGVSEDMLKQMLNDLVRLGYAENINPSCSTNPSSANQCKKCASHLAMWMLTEKGRKAAGNKVHV